MSQLFLLRSCAVVLLKEMPVCCNVLQCVAVCVAVRSRAVVLLVDMSTRRMMLYWYVWHNPFVYGTWLSHGHFTWGMPDWYVWHVSFVCVTWLIHTCMSLRGGGVSGYQQAHCNTLQHTAAHCNILQYTATHVQHTATYNKYAATHCSTLQHTATYCNISGCHLRSLDLWCCLSPIRKEYDGKSKVTGVHETCHVYLRLKVHCNTLQHTATHCNTLQHTATHCNTLQYTATHCYTLQHTATYCNTLQHLRCKSAEYGRVVRVGPTRQHLSCESVMWLIHMTHVWMSVMWHIHTCVIF